MPRNPKTRTTAVPASGSGGVAGGTQSGWEGFSRLSYDREPPPFFDVGCSPEALFENWEIGELSQLRDDLIQMRSRAEDLLTAIDGDSGGAAGRQGGIAMRTRSTSPVSFTGGYDEDGFASQQIGQQVQRPQSAHPVLTVRCTTTDKNETMKLKRPRSEDQPHESKRGRGARNRSTSSYYEEEQTTPDVKHSTHRSHSTLDSVNTDDFWTHMNTYLRPMIDDDLQYVMPMDDKTLNAVLTIPPLGGSNGPQTTPTTPASGPSSTAANQTNSAARFVTRLSRCYVFFFIVVDINSGATQTPLVGALTQRLMAAFIPCSQPATIQIDMNSRVPTALPQAEHDTMFEEALQKVLVTHGLLDPSVPLVCLPFHIMSNYVITLLFLVFRIRLELQMKMMKYAQSSGNCSKTIRIFTCV